MLKPRPGPVLLYASGKVTVSVGFNEPLPVTVSW